MTKLTDLRKLQPTEVPFESLKVGQAYEDMEGNVCIKTLLSFDIGDNCIYFNADINEWESAYEPADEMVNPLNIEINILS